MAERFTQIVSHLQKGEELTMAVEAEANFTKLLVMACGSFFEEQITGIVERFATKHDARLGAFVQKKALHRQYHTLFDWDQQSNVNKFLALFGDGFKATANSKIKSMELGECVRSFLLVGATRNRLAHENMASVSLSMTKNDIMDHYRRAWKFVRFVESQFEQNSPQDSDSRFDTSDTG